MGERGKRESIELPTPRFWHSIRHLRELNSPLHMASFKMKRLLSSIFIALLLLSCGHDSPEYTRITARVTEPTTEIQPGEHELGLGGPRLVNRKVEWKDGYLYVPGAASYDRPLPLLIWMRAVEAMPNPRATCFL